MSGLHSVRPLPHARKPRFSGVAGALSGTDPLGRPAAENRPRVGPRWMREVIGQDSEDRGVGAIQGCASPIFTWTPSVR